MARSTRTKWKLWDKFGTIFIVIIQAVPAAAYHILIQFAGSQSSLRLPMLFSQGNLRSYILPIFSLAIGNIAYYAMWLRRYMVDESNKDYIRLARAKGLPSGAISRRHMFRNAMVPLIQYIPNSILFTLMGSLYVESLYSIPGMGGLLVTVIKRQDNTMVVALVLIYAAISILGLLLGEDVYKRQLKGHWPLRIPLAAARFPDVAIKTGSQGPSGVPQREKRAPATNLQAPVPVASSTANSP